MKLKMKISYGDYENNNADYVPSKPPLSFSLVGMKMKKKMKMRMKMKMSVVVMRTLSCPLKPTFSFFLAFSWDEEDEDN